MARIQVADERTSQEIKTLVEDLSIEIADTSGVVSDIDGNKYKPIASTNSYSTELYEPIVRQYETIIAYEAWRFPNSGIPAVYGANTPLEFGRFPSENSASFQQHVMNAFKNHLYDNVYVIYDNSSTRRFVILFDFDTNKCLFAKITANGTTALIPTLDPIQNGHFVTIEKTAGGALGNVNYYDMTTGSLAHSVPITYQSSTIPSFICFTDKNIVYSIGGTGVRHFITKNSSGFITSIGSVVGLSPTTGTIIFGYFHKGFLYVGSTASTWKLTENSDGSFTSSSSVVTSTTATSDPIFIRVYETSAYGDVLVFKHNTTARAYTLDPFLAGASIGTSAPCPPPAPLQGKEGIYINRYLNVSTVQSSSTLLSFNDENGKIIWREAIYNTLLGFNSGNVSTLFRTPIRASYNGQLAIASPIMNINSSGGIHFEDGSILAENTSTKTLDLFAPVYQEVGLVKAGGNA